jgi:hypothetical protein
MDFNLDRVQVWGIDVPDRPGGAASVLEPLSKAGANLEYVVSRRLPNRPGWGELYVAPITGPAQTKAIMEAHGHRVNDFVLLRIYGSDKQGLAHHMATCLASAGINLRNMTMMAVDGKFIAYVACDNPEDTARAIQALAALKA